MKEQKKKVLLIPFSLSAEEALARVKAFFGIGKKGEFKSEEKINLNKPMEPKNRNFYIINRESIDGQKEQKKIFLIPKNELGQYEEIGRSGGPIGMALHMGFQHCDNFFERVAGFTVSESGFGKMMSEAVEKVLPELNKRQPEIRYTYTFYEKK